jgi:hypothetical protein
MELLTPIAAFTPIDRPFDDARLVGSGDPPEVDCEGLDVCKGLDVCEGAKAAVEELDVVWGATFHPTIAEAKAVTLVVAALVMKDQEGPVSFSAGEANVRISFSGTDDRHVSPVNTL